MCYNTADQLRNCTITSLSTPPMFYELEFEGLNQNKDGYYAYDDVMGKIDVEFYDTENGWCPVANFIRSLEPKMCAKVLRTIDLLENNGVELRGPYSMPVGDGIFELRIKHGSDISRVLCFFFIGNKAVLTNGFVKKTTKTPPAEIVLAKKYKADYQRRNYND